MLLVDSRQLARWWQHMESRHARVNISVPSSFPPAANSHAFSERRCHALATHGDDREQAPFVSGYRQRQS